ncbi:unnamed protein product [Medioppia subpectinata]|uniref:Protein kinase domain-containing protein n=1 Tax=Medioppia subpectinata TaxID=1979941 RepID=A0A7R9LBL9_9ACAR|nr:unnamed protein product [Medioppia subpectinata]CAG2117486.1 unnamed protein product [Medioppia subpectinata]
MNEISIAYKQRVKDNPVLSHDLSTTSSPIERSDVYSTPKPKKPTTGQKKDIRDNNIQKSEYNSDLLDKLNTRLTTDCQEVGEVLPNVGNMMSKILLNISDDNEIIWEKSVAKTPERSVNRFVCHESVRRVLNDWGTVDFVKPELLDNNDPKSLDIKYLSLGFVRNETKGKSMSPILTEAKLFHRPSDDIITDEEIECLRALNFSIVGVMLNEGTFATIYESRHECGLDIAIKRSLAFGQSYAELNAFTALSKHDNIVGFYGFQRIGCRMYLFLELTQSGDLAHYLFNEYRDEDLSENEIHGIFSDVFKGVQYMHSKGYSHRDLKLQNVLVFAEKNGVSLRHKLCDFGSARGDTRLTDESVKLSTTLIGFIQSKAPEEAICAYNPIVSDIYSLGVILYQLSHSGDFPFGLFQSNQNIKKLIENLTLCKLWSNSITYSSFISEDLRNLLKRMLSPFPKFRITLDEIESHEWFVKEDRP